MRRSVRCGTCWVSERLRPRHHLPQVVELRLPRGGDRIGVRDEVVETVIGDLHNLTEQLQVLLLRGVLQPAQTLRDDLTAGVHPAQAGDEGHTEPLVVLVGEIPELLLLHIVHLLKGE